MPNCLLCNASSRLWATIDGWPIHDCVACGHRFAVVDDSAEHINRTYGDDYFFGGGSGYDDYLQESELLVERGRWYARQLARRAAPGRLLEAGSASGFTLLAFQEAGWDCRGVEPNATMVEHASGLGVDVKRGTLADASTEDRYDLIVMLQVIAHLPEVEEEVARVAKLLRPGGGCLVETWDRGSWPARLLGRSWHEYSPPSVLHWFSRGSLDRLMGRHGLAAIGGGRPPKRIKASHVRSLLEYKAAGGSRLAAGAAQVARVLPSGATLPCPSWDLFWRLYEKPAEAGG